MKFWFLPAMAAALLLSLAAPALADNPTVEGLTLVLGMGEYSENKPETPDPEDGYSQFSGFIAGGFRKQAFCNETDYSNYCPLWYGAELQATLVADTDNRHQYIALGNVGYNGITGSAHILGGVGYSDHAGFGPVFGVQLNLLVIINARILFHAADHSAFTFSVGLDVLTLWRIIRDWNEVPRSPVGSPGPPTDKPYTFDSNTSPDGRRPTAPR